jgi:hypothetical protein
MHLCWRLHQLKAATSSTADIAHSVGCLCVCAMVYCTLQLEQMTDFKREMQDIALKKK